MLLLYSALFLLVAYLSLKLFNRLVLSRAKHPSISGHARISRWLASRVTFYEYGTELGFRSDGAPDEVAEKRKAGLHRLAEGFTQKAPLTHQLGQTLESSISDLKFTNAYRVPFQFRRLVGKHLPVPAVAAETEGVKIRDLDGNWSFDVSGSYGVNLLGYDFYKSCLRTAVATADSLGPVLGPYHPLIAENIAMLKQVSGMDEVSFHMSGTEAVMQAVRLARFHTGRKHLVQFCGAYHGWWDGVQPGVGNGRSSKDVFLLQDMSKATLRVLNTRRDIACVLINPLQVMHPNSGASSDAMLVASDRKGRVDVTAYRAWLKELREVCTRKSIVLIFDEVFVGFRLAKGGAQEYFEVSADLVVYGKTVGGGLPIGVVCGKSHLMKRYREDRPLNICFARGTFNSHPYVMASMNGFLRFIQGHDYHRLMRENEAVWDARAARLNQRLEDATLPLRVCNLGSVWTILYPMPGRYNWMFQFYLRAEGIALSWVGTGRLIFSLDYSEEDFEEVMSRILRAAQRMRSDGWWWHDPAQTNRSIRRRVFREMLLSKWRGNHAKQPNHLATEGSVTSASAGAVRPNS